jgi:WS/DGAT/MGAT family acyltransferase
VGKGYARLSALDGSYFTFEATGSHAHITAVAIFEMGPLLAGSGGLEIERIRRHVESRLPQLPHYRHRIAFTPMQRHPIWVDDSRFDLRYHVRHTGLPQPGSDADLKELAGRISSQQLDRDKPLWEIWFVEGLRGDRFAAVAKVHHSLVDGVSGVNLLTSLLSPSDDGVLEPATRWKPRPPPGLLDFLKDGVTEGVGFGASALRAAADALSTPRQSVEEVARGAVSAWETIVGGLTRPAETPINKPIGDQRRVDWVSLDLAQVRDLRKRLDGTLNDVVLTIVTGAVRSLLRKRRVPLRGLDYRVTVPVDVRKGPLDAEASNRVSAWFLSLPVAERDPKRRFEKIRQQTRRLKRTKAENGVDFFLRFADWSGSSMLPSGFVNLVGMLRPYNLIVSNIHGPEFPLYLLGARLNAFYPHLPLFKNQGLAVAAMSYLDTLNVGLIGDWDLMHDLADFADHIEESVEGLRVAANGDPSLRDR